MKPEDLDKIADEYHLNVNVSDKFIEDIAQRHFCNWLKERFDGSRKCLELGYGEGITAKELSSHFSNYTIVEGSEKLVELAKQECPEAKLDKGLFEEYAPAEKFDLILALHVLEHVDNPAEILGQIKKWLNDEGSLVVLVPNRNSMHRQFALGMGLISKLDELSDRDLQVGHQRVYDLADLKQDLVNEEFVVVDEAGFFLKALPNSMMIDFNSKLIEQFNLISDSISPELLANICVVATMKKSSNCP